MRPERDSQEQPWGKVLFPYQQIHTISLSYFADTKIHSWWDAAQGMQPDPRVITPEG